MPAANLYTTNEAQDFLKEKVQSPLRIIFEALASPRNIWQLIWLCWYAFKTILEIRKLKRPTRDSVNKHNSKVLIDIRDWFLQHEAPNSPRYKFFDGFLSFLAIKYDFDDFFSKRLDAWLRRWKKSPWQFTGKHPETYWNLSEEEKKEPEAIRQKALVKALNDRDYDKVLGLIE